MASRTGTFSTSVGTKIVIGITGIALSLPPDSHRRQPGGLPRARAYKSAYARGSAAGLEIALLLVFLFHIYKTIRMFLGNQSTRPVGYAQKKYAGPPSRKSFASSTMIVSGLWLLAFLVVHVKTFRFGVEQEWPAGGRDLYLLEMQAFTNPLIVGFYVISMVVVGSHLWHGISSAFQSLGLDTPAWTRLVLPAGKVIAVLIAAGFIVIAVWAHLNGVRS
jgi:succinate dehydrogenase / fumarate reductase cytochrome b subunit